MGKKTVARHYVPSARVQAQLAGAPPFGSQEFWERVALRDREHPDYFDAEVLVTALRAFLLHDDLDSAHRICVELLDRWKGYIYVQAWSWCSDSEEDRQDMRQEISTRLWAVLLNPAKSFWEANFYTALHDLCCDVGRKFERLRERECPLPSGYDEDGEPLDELPDVIDPQWQPTDELMVSEEERDRIRGVVTALPAPISQVLYLYYVKGWQIQSTDPSVMTISKALNVTDRTVKKRLALGRAMVRAKYEREETHE